MTNLISMPGASEWSILLILLAGVGLIFLFKYINKKKSPKNLANDELMKLNDLKAKGLITDEDFQELKKKVLEKLV